MTTNNLSNQETTNLFRMLTAEKFDTDIAASLRANLRPDAAYALLEPGTPFIATYRIYDSNIEQTTTKHIGIRADDDTMPTMMEITDNRPNTVAPLSLIDTIQIAELRGGNTPWRNSENTPLLNFTMWPTWATPLAIPNFHFPTRHCKHHYYRIDDTEQYRLWCATVLKPVKGLTKPGDLGPDYKSHWVGCTLNDKTAVFNEGGFPLIVRVDGNDTNPQKFPENTDTCELFDQIGAASAGAVTRTPLLPSALIDEDT